MHPSVCLVFAGGINTIRTVAEVKLSECVKITIDIVLGVDFLRRGGFFTLRFVTQALSHPFHSTSRFFGSNFALSRARLSYLSLFFLFLAPLQDEVQFYLPDLSQR
jgi:hypothetical protein